MPTYRLHITGLVQGVGYRAYCAREAQRLKINGQVRNLCDGTVEVLCETDEQTLRSFEMLLRKGPRFSQVRNVEINSCALQFDTSGFHIVSDDTTLRKRE